MEAMDERRIWQRVRGEEPEAGLRELLEQQGKLSSQYRQLSRRGGKFRQLFEQKEAQIACLRGLLRVRTGQGVAHPPVTGGPVDLLKCFEQEKRFLQDLTDRAGDPIFAALRDRQGVQCRLLLELIATL